MYIVLYCFQNILIVFISFYPYNDPMKLLLLFYQRGILGLKMIKSYS